MPKIISARRVFGEEYGLWIVKWDDNVACTFAKVESIQEAIQMAIIKRKENDNA